MRDFVAEKELGDRVSLPGNVSDSTLGRLYKSADCVVIPSRSESIPLVFSEALRFDRELIVADVGDLGMLGRRYGVAQVVPPENVSSLKEEMKRKIEVEEEHRGKGKGKERRVAEMVQDRNQCGKVSGRLYPPVAEMNPDEPLCKASNGAPTIPTGLSGWFGLGFCSMRV